MTTQTEPPFLTAASGSDFGPFDTIEQPQRPQAKTITAATKSTPEEYDQNIPGWPWDL